MTSRPLEIPRLTEGTRVRYDFGKWSCCANSVRHDPAWAAADWAYSYTGLVVPITEHRGHIYPPHHPWGVPHFATVIRWDHTDRVDWIRTSCLDPIGFAEKPGTTQTELFSFTPQLTPVQP